MRAFFQVYLKIASLVNIHVISLNREYCEQYQRTRLLEVSTSCLQACFKSVLKSIFDLSFFFTGPCTSKDGVFYPDAKCVHLLLHINIHISMWFKICHSLLHTQLPCSLFFWLSDNIHDCYYWLLLCVWLPVRGDELHYREYLYQVILNWRLSTVIHVSIFVLFNLPNFLE